MVYTFANRRSAGKLLAKAIISQAPHLSHQPDVVVLGLPRGGIPVAFEVAQRLHAPLDAYVVRKLGTPGQEELAMGALAPDGTSYLDHRLIMSLGITKDEIEACKKRELRELNRRVTLYRVSPLPPEVNEKKVILVDDGLATGASMRTAIMALRKEGPAYMMVAVPVAPHSTIKDIKPLVDTVICLAEPEPFIGVGMWYKNFSQTTDEEVRKCLRFSRKTVPIRNQNQSQTSRSILPALKVPPELESHPESGHRLPQSQDPMVQLPAKEKVTPETDRV
jgi:putative phosphoribosyl transferase